MARHAVTIAELRHATRNVHCMYAGLVRLGNIWRVLDKCGDPPAWGRKWVEPWGSVCVSTDYTEANLADGLRRVQEQIDRREKRNAQDRARRLRRRTTLFAKAD